MSPEHHAYVRPLKKRIAGHKKPGQSTKRARPTLFVPGSSVDVGDRPLAYAGEYYNSGIVIRNALTGTVEPTKVGRDYLVSLRVRNSGALAAYSAVGEVYAGPPRAFSALAGGPISEQQQAALGVRRIGRRLGFVLQPGQQRDDLLAQAVWQPAAANESLVAQVYDPICDRIEHPFDPSDRHVARRDHVLPLGGMWEGTARKAGATKQSIRVHLTMTQNVAGPVPGLVKLSIKLEIILGVVVVGTSSGTAQGVLLEDTLRFSETFSQPGTTINWVALHKWIAVSGAINEKLQVNFGEFTGQLDHLRVIIPSTVYP
jgi:hypothetical protein